MPWLKTANAAMFDGADWASFIETVPLCPPKRARRLALINPDVGFFFHCREHMVLINPSWSVPREFNPGDAVFFSGEPTYGSAPQADTYVKDGLTVAYVGHQVSATSLATVACYVTADGGAAVDVVCVVGPNLCASQPPDSLRLAPGVKVPANGTYACGSQSLVDALESDAIRQLQSRGITVLLSFLNNHDAAGWSQFGDAALASNFVEQLQVIVEKYGLDGIDIDDEYSHGSPVTTSLAMVTGMMKQALPGKIISKALWNDLSYFGVAYNGTTLEQTLSYGWEMSYGNPPQDRLPPYVEVGMRTNSLALGFWADQPSSKSDADVRWLKSSGYTGTMVYAFQDPANQTLLGSLVDDWCGPHQWNKLPNCPDMSIVQSG